jgi:hypothetical protein
MVFSVTVLFGAALHAGPPPRTIVIDRCKKKAPGVVLKHERHVKRFKVPCRACHVHTRIKPRRCSACHSGKANPRYKVGCAEPGMKKNPYHLVCVGCHKAKKKGPRACKGCHRPGAKKGK